ncbi:hypothetical protein NDU88_003823 [Pleurodeles waltl]|uniref:Uncharacterized protein n=1 Tax=Pleurodeles waltl TaxID=8319 RepID=A0AAV7WQ46_PLEWA|nr:hypothetical protein NDU88_003823 [Pleurodeles waltl]
MYLVCARRYISRKSSRTMIQKSRSAGCDLPASVSDAARHFSCSVRRFFGRVSCERRFSAAEPAMCRFFTRGSDLRQSFPCMALCAWIFLSLGCQLLLSGSQELDGHHRAE